MAGESRSCHPVLGPRMHQELEPVRPTTSGIQHVADGIIDLAGGTAGGIACVYSGQPLDTVKVKMQTFPDLYRNGIQCLVKTFRNDGVRRGLYAGTTPALASNIAENAVLFCAYGFCRKIVAYVTKKEMEDLNPINNACSGPWNLTKQILRDDGIRGLFRGLTPTILREVPGYFFFFYGYEFSRAWLTEPEKSKDDLGVAGTAFSGGMAGICCWTAVYPADVVKSRMQVQADTSVLKTFSNIVRNEGIRTLYKGFGPQIIRTFIATGALFVAYEGTTKGLHQFIDPLF